MTESGRDARFFQAGSVAELRAELYAEKKGKGRARKLMALKRIIANATMGNDMSALFADMVACMDTPALDVKKMVCEWPKWERRAVS